MRRPLAPTVVTLLLLAPPVASAHGDRVVAPTGTRIEVPAGGEASLPFQAHYHRLVGTIAPHDDSALVLAVERAGGGPALWTSGPIDVRQGLNALVLCCDDATWSDLRVLVRSAVPGAGASATVAIEAVHDDFYVAGAAKEGGGFETPLLFGLAAALLGRSAWSAWRAPAPHRPHARRGARVARSAVFTAAVIVAVLAAGSWGAARFGGTRVEGFLAAAGAIFPWWGSVSAFVVVLVPWAAALALWARGYREAVAGAARASVVAAVGVAQALAIAGLPFFFAGSYGREVFAITAWAFWPTAAVQLGMVATLFFRPPR